MRCLIHGVIVALAAAVAAPAAASGDAVVVELFTSQGCYSCPPAEAFLGELAGRDDVIALEFHVDYWNDLNYGAAGKWRDVFSKPAFTARQRAYNSRIRRRPAVYTPQMVIDGRLETVGSRRAAVNAHIRQAQADTGSRVMVSVRRAGDGLEVALDGAEKANAAVWPVRFRLAEITRVLAGENQGKTLKSHNIVTALSRIGEWTGAPRRLTLPGPRLASGKGCAVIVQTPRPDPILGAALCPLAEAS